MGCQEKDITPEIQKDLFPYLINNQNSRHPFCDPTFVTWREEVLSVYCLPLGEGSNNETKDMVKDQTVKLTQHWANQKKMNVKSIRARFTDEIIAEGKK